MRRVVVCPTDFLFRLFQGTPGNSDSWVFLVSDGKTRTESGPPGRQRAGRRARRSGPLPARAPVLVGPRHADGPGAARRGPSLGADPGDRPGGGARGARPGRPPGRPAALPAPPPEREHGDARAHDARGPSPRDGPRPPARPHRADAPAPRGQGPRGHPAPGRPRSGRDGLGPRAPSPARPHPRHGPAPVVRPRDAAREPRDGGSAGDRGRPGHSRRGSARTTRWRWWTCSRRSARRRSRRSPSSSIIIRRRRAGVRRSATCGRATARRRRSWRSTCARPT